MKFLYKIFIFKLFKIIFEKINKSKKKINNELKITNLNFYKKKFKLYEFYKGRIFTDCVTNVAYIQNNYMVRTLSR